MKWANPKKDLEGFKLYQRDWHRAYRRKKGLKREPYKTTEAIMKEAGHCGYCGMLLESEYHKKHPLVGCLKANK